MHTRKVLACLLLVLILSLSLAPAAFADVVFAGEDETLTGEYDSTVLLAGSNPTSTANVKGILFEAGNTVRAGGSSEYAFVAGNMVTYSGANSADAFVAGNSVSFLGSCARDLCIVGNAVEIRGTVGRDVAAGGSSVVIDGEVGGNVLLTAEEIVITDTAKIGGSLRYNSSAKITAPAELLKSAATYEDKSADSGESAAQESAPSPLSKLKSKVFGFVGLLLIAYFLLWLTPLWEKIDARYAGKSFGSYAAAFGIGFAVLAAAPLASIILMITGFGLRPAFVLLLVYIAALLVSPVFLGFFLGSLLWRRALKKQANFWAELAIGLALWCILTALPYVAGVTRLVSAPLGLGVCARLFGKKRSAGPALPETAANT